MEKFSNATFFRQIALQNLQRKNLGFSETGFVCFMYIPVMKKIFEINTTRTCSSQGWNLSDRSPVDEMETVLLLQL